MKGVCNYRFCVRLLAAMETKEHKYQVKSKSTTGNPHWEEYFSLLYKNNIL